ncbi:MAG: hypothetical protein ACM3PP_13955 [Candidatus Saccharibacteria bacterium]
MNKREKYLTLTFATMLIGYLLYSQYIEVHYNRVLTLQNELTVIQESVTKVQAYGSLDEIKRKTLSVQQEIYKYSNFAPQIKDTPGLLVTLHDLRTKYMLTPPQDTVNNKKQIEITDLVKVNNYYSFDITFALAGTSKNLYDFINELENIKRPLVIQHISITSPKIGMIQGEITVRVFVMDNVKSDPKNYPFMDTLPSGLMPYDMFGPSTSITNSLFNGGLPSVPTYNNNNMPNNNLPAPPSTSNNETMPDPAPPTGNSTINPTPPAPTEGNEGSNSGLESTDSSGGPSSQPVSDGSESSASDPAPNSSEPEPGASSDPVP